LLNYIASASEGVIVKIREENTLLNELEPVCKDYKMKHVCVFVKGYNLQQLRLKFHELAMLWSIIFEVTII
jgi:hypothetical protein